MDFEVQAQREARKQSNIMVIKFLSWQDLCAWALPLVLVRLVWLMAMPTEQKRFSVPLSVLYRAFNRFSHRESR